MDKYYVHLSLKLLTSFSSTILMHQKACQGASSSQHQAPDTQSKDLGRNRIHFPRNFFQIEEEDSEYLAICSPFVNMTEGKYYL